MQSTAQAAVHRALDHYRGSIQPSRKAKPEITSGMRCEMDFCGKIIRGRIDFIEDGWIYWIADNGDVWCSRIRE